MRVVQRWGEVVHRAGPKREHRQLRYIPDRPWQDRHGPSDVTKMGRMPWVEVGVGDVAGHSPSIVLLLLKFPERPVAVVGSGGRGSGGEAAGAGGEGRKDEV